MASLCPEDLIRQNIELASMPEIIVKLNQAVDDPYSTAKDISDILSEDPALTARLLRIVNSPFYGFPSQIDTISLAVTVVGTQQLRLLALASSTLRQFANLPNQFVTMETFWRHSFSSAVVSRAIAKLAKEPDDEQYFIAGLLHDLGSLIIYSTIPTLAKEAITHAKRKEIPVYQAERAIIGFDHAMVGSALLRHWNLPEALVEAVACHHELGDIKICPKHKAITHLANIVANSINPGLLLYRQTLEPESQAWELTGLESDTIDAVLDDMEKEINEAISAFSLNSVA